MLKKSMLFTVIVSILTGCGGGSDDTAGMPVQPPVPVIPKPTQVTVKVIDGYLQHAAVCVDRNQNNSCEANEYLPNKTNALGEVVVESADTAYPLIAEVKAGISIDADSGFAANSYQMIAKAGAKQISPFSTLAVQNNMSEQNVASSINLSVDVVFSDYAALTTLEAQKARLIARSLTRNMTSLMANKPQGLMDAAIQLSNFVAQNSITDLAAMTVIQTDNGLSIQPNQASIKQVLTSQNEWTYASFDPKNFATENFRIARFKDNKVDFYNEWDNHRGGESISYSVDSLRNAAGTAYLEKFVYVSDEILIGQTDSKVRDLNFWLPGFKGVKQIGFTPMPLPLEQFGHGKIWYHIIDDGEDFVLSEMTFNVNGMVDIKTLPAKEQMTVAYSVKDAHRPQLTIAIHNEEKPFLIQGWTGNNQLLLVNHVNRKMFALFTQDKELAYAIIGK